MRAVVLLLMVCFFVTPALSQSSANPQVLVNLYQPAALTGPAVDAEGAILLDGASGRVLWEKNGQKTMYPASTTKVMTAILALENLSLDESVTVSKKAATTGEQSMGLKQGETRTVEELLYGALLHSGNDAAQALADHVAAKYNRDFVEWMNLRAKELGAQHSHFVNPHGLHDPNHYSTPYDLAILIRHAIFLPRFTEIASTLAKNLPWPEKGYDMTLINQNKLLWRYPGTDSGKTGYTRQAGNTLIASAVRNNMRLVLAVCKTHHSFDDATTLFNFGFQNFAPVQLPVPEVEGLQIPVEGGELSAVPVRLASPVETAVITQERDKLTMETHVETKLTAPVAEGQEVGETILLLQGKPLARYPIVAAAPVKGRGYGLILWDVLRWAFGPLTP